MTTARRSRWAGGGMAGLFWAATIGAAMTELNLKMFLVLWLATLLVSLWALAAWLTRGDHGALAQARVGIEAARLSAALSEESAFRHDSDHLKPWINSVAS